MEMKVRIKIGVKDMFYFLFRHMYTSLSGMIGLLISAAALILLVAEWGKMEGMKLVLVIFVAAMFTVIQPLRLLSKAVQQVKINPMFQKPLDYTFTEAGMTVEQEDQRLELEWNQISRVIKTKRGLQIYLDRVRGYILPADQLDGKTEELAAFIRENREKCLAQQKEEAARQAAETAPAETAERKSIRDLASMKTDELESPEEPEEAEEEKTEE